jgi:hypothetical protein
MAMCARERASELERESERGARGSPPPRHDRQHRSRWKLGRPNRAFTSFIVLYGFSRIRAPFTPRLEPRTQITFLTPLLRPSSHPLPPCELPGAENLAVARTIATLDYSSLPVQLCLLTAPSTLPHPPPPSRPSPLIRPSRN